MSLNREAWLNTAARELNKLIIECTELEPAEDVFVSTGWPRRDRGGKVIGQCWGKQPGGERHIYVSPLLESPADVLSTLLHELIHSADDCQHGHKGPFRKAWKALGFVGKATQSTPGADLLATLNVIAEDLGAYPHKKLSTVDGPKKQTTRMLKLECPDCGYIARTTAKWLEVGHPTCPCGTKMRESK